MGGGADVAMGSLITAASGLIGVVLTTCWCVYRRDDEGMCMPACGFSDKPLTPERHPIEIVRETLDEIHVLIICKKDL